MQFDSAVAFSLAFEGEAATYHQVDFYDVSQALIGFQRSLALMSHLVLNDEIITQAPSLKGAKIFATPPIEGSWKITAAISLVGSLHALGTAQGNSPIGHIMFSLYDYVISESLGMHVDYNKSLGQLYEEAQNRKIKVPEVTQSQADSLVEKCSVAIREMHRPIYKSATASVGQLTAKIGTQDMPLGVPMTLETYGYINETYAAEQPEIFVGRVSSYNSNTYKGRIYLEEFHRPIPFILGPNSRGDFAVGLITASLSANALRSYAAGRIKVAAIRNTSKSGNIKSLTVLQVFQGE